MSVILSPPLPAEESKVKERYWTAEEFYRAADAGVFDDPGRLELIHGRIIEKMPQSPSHRSRRVRIGRRLRAVMEPRFLVIDECPVHIAFDGEPIPDVAVVTGTENDYDQRHPIPEDVALLVEVAVSSVENDTSEKALLYAQAGIRDYWVVLVEQNAILVHREPMPNGYQNVERRGVTDTISPLAASEVVFSVRDLLPD